MKRFNKNKIIALILLSVILTAFGGAIIVSAATQTPSPTTGQYTPLTPLPGITPSTPTNLGTYANAMVKILIGIAAVLAIIMIMIGGLQYMSTDAISGKTEGKERITQALFGLGLAIASWLILATISPTLLKVDLSIPFISPSTKCLPTLFECNTQLGEYRMYTVRNRCVAEPAVCGAYANSSRGASGVSDYCFDIEYSNCQPPSSRN